jgi:hypothetical protein
MANKDNGWGVYPIANPSDLMDYAEGELRMDDKGGFIQKPSSVPSTEARLSGPSPRPGSRGLAGSVPVIVKPKAQKRSAPTPEELMAKAKAMLATQNASSRASMDAGPSVGKMDANGNELPPWLVNEMGK